ncbi:lasso peptide biosynthesis B2 protein [Parasphingopyxis algicola]|uniref:lasso peptide biosynthesis B2 protein n=1 Tax=Parasphingopyxis algicola TaxID=2026624 RepID=UPI0015A0C043|nr:lasso peptide biosynthesis B2 protein [Parasphingopyxis algicola]QLC24896.1 lasso peptide biosynthesis B2 protein [Parasphingopyxis algicola]
MDMMARPQYFLTEKTFLCLTDGIFVFLDLKNDKYSALERQHTGAFARLVGLYSLRNESDAIGPAEIASVADVMDDLETHGLLTRDAETGKPAELIEERRDLKELLGYEIGESPAIRVYHVINFFSALIVVKTMLRFASMDRIITRVRRRRERNRSRLQDGPEAPDLDRVNEMVEIYKMLKPLFVTVKDNCLFNSFFLIEFLARYGIYPNWVFGVRLNEFYAHCWVQDGDLIYDDFVDTVCQNQPIMAV